MLFILTDDLGFSDLGCYGGEIATPNIDKLAHDGLCYNSARCCPSRAALITGLTPHQAGIGFFATAKPEAGKESMRMSYERRSTNEDSFTHRS